MVLHIQFPLKMINLSDLPHVCGKLLDTPDYQGRDHMRTSIHIVIYFDSSNRRRTSSEYRSKIADRLIFATLPELNWSKSFNSRYTEWVA